MLIVALLVPTLVAVIAALAGWPVVTCTAVVLVLGVLAFQDRAVPRPTRWLLRAGLLLLAIAEVLSVWGSGAAGALAPSWQLPMAGCLVLACVLLSVALNRLPREWLTRLGLVAPMAGALTLAIFVVLGLLASALRDRSAEPVLLATVALGLCGLAVAWIVRRHGLAGVAALGAGALTVTTFSALYDAWLARPLPPEAFLQPGIRVDAGPDIGPAIGVVLLLAGAIITVLTCVRLSEPTPAAG